MAYNTTKKVIAGALVGLAAGYIAGVLTAPKSGKETREDIKQAGTKAIKEIERRLQVVYAQLDEALDIAKARAFDLGERGKKELSELQGKAEDAKHKVSELLHAVKEGEADDPSLQAAVTEATQAKDDLVEYLKK